MKAKFDLKEDATPIFQLKRQVPFTALVNIDKELERLEKLGGNRKKNDYSPYTQINYLISSAEGIKLGSNIFKIGFVGGLHANTSR